jgi:hypothetical protein
LTVKDQVEIEGAGAPSLIAYPTKGSFDMQQPSQQRVGDRVVLIKAQAFKISG